MRRLLWLAALVGVTVVMPHVVRAGDQEIAEDIKYNLRDSLKNYKIGIRVQDGTAWLDGSVSNPRQMDAAVEIARQTGGVQRVVNNLAIGQQGTAPRSGQSLLRQPSGISAGMSNGGRPEFDDRPPAGYQTTPVGYPTAPVAYQAAPMRRQPVTRTAAELPDHAQQELRVAGPMSEPPDEPAPFNDSNFRGNGNYGSAAAPPPRGWQGQSADGYRPDNSAYAQGGRSYPQGMSTARANPNVMQQGRPAQPLPLAMANGAPPRQAAVQYDGPESIGAPQPLPAAAPMGPGAPAPYHYDSPSMPGYAWPSYAAYPNYAAVTYPKQYSPTAWPYIGPFYPYPQVPLGWRKVTLEWDDGWWFLDFKDSH